MATYSLGVLLTMLEESLREADQYDREKAIERFVLTYWDEIEDAQKREAKK